MLWAPANRRALDCEFVLPSPVRPEASGGFSNPVHCALASLSESVFQHQGLEGLGEADHARLGGRVIDLSCSDFLTVDRGNLDDTAGSVATHPLNHRARHGEHRIQIGGENGAPVRPAHRVKHAIPCDPGIIDRVGERIMSRFDGRDTFTTGRVIHNIPLKDAAPVPCLDCSAASSLPCQMAAAVQAVAWRESATAAQFCDFRRSRSHVRS